MAFSQSCFKISQWRFLLLSPSSLVPTYLGHRYAEYGLRCLKNICGLNNFVQMHRVPGPSGPYLVAFLHILVPQTTHHRLLSHGPPPRLAGKVLFLPDRQYISSMFDKGPCSRGACQHSSSRMWGSEKHSVYNFLRASE